MAKFKIGITTGDINGIGPEVILKTFMDERMLQLCTPVIYGSSKVMAYHKNILENGQDVRFQGHQNADRIPEGRINVINCWQDGVNITIGNPTKESGQFALNALEQAVKDLKNKKIDALVTAPINKKAMNLADFPFPGHTEFLTQQSHGKRSLMMMVNDDLRIGLVTNHLPLRDVADAVTKEKVQKKLHLFHESLVKDFGIEKPVIAVLGLNPHAGDDGVLGEEDDKIIRPVVIEAKKKGVLAIGPFPADGFFGSGEYKKYDGILAMYHDQGLVAFKSLSFGEGVNFTAGLDFIRTSPDHGTAYKIAGKNLADESSFRAAIYAAKDLWECRKDYYEDRQNTVEKTFVEEEIQPEDS